MALSFRHELMLEPELHSQPLQINRDTCYLPLEHRLHLEELRLDPIQLVRLKIQQFPKELCPNVPIDDGIHRV